MKQQLIKRIKDFLFNHPENLHPATGKKFYDEPDVFFASADDPIFEKFKDVVSPEHLTPKEIIELEYGEGSYSGGTVIVIIQAIQEDVRKSNRSRTEMASAEWALSRAYGDEIFLKTRIKEIAGQLKEEGYKAVVPWLSDWFRVMRNKRDLTSNWSERHAAYAAGAGTFGLNDGFISDKGMSIRIMTIVTDLVIEPDVRQEGSHTRSCLFLSKGLCGACIKRCPADAISKDGHDKMKCYMFVYGEASKKFAVEAGGLEKAGSGCGLCQTKVPCEFRNPMAKIA